MFRLHMIINSAAFCSTSSTVFAVSVLLIHFKAV